jgi:hypothetical protein
MSPNTLNIDLCRVKVNADVEYPVMPSTAVAEYRVGFIPAVNGGAFSSRIT